MISIFIIIFLIITLCSIYLGRAKNKPVLTIFVFCFLSVLTCLIYLKKGGIETFTFEDTLNKYVGDIINKTKNLDEMDPQLMITFMEKKLDEEPNDIEGWLILARTCVISGHFQKADMHYKSALEIFPNNENVLLEYSILKKNINQTESAIKLLKNLKHINPNNIKAREMIIEILLKNPYEEKALNEIEELFEIKKEDTDYIKNLKKKYNLE